MGWFDGDSDQGRAHESYQSAPKHEAHVSHELLGGAAAFAAAKAYEDYQTKNGKPSSHAKAIEIVSGLAGAFIEREVETKGLDFIDRKKAEKHAREHWERELENDRDSGRVRYD